MDLTPEDLDKRLNGFGWQDAWDNLTAPGQRRFICSRSLPIKVKVGGSLGDSA
jgi:hypothetical protein